MSERYLTEAESRELARRALAMSSADEARVNISSSVQGNTRFAVNKITTSGDVEDATLTISSAFGRRIGSATTNRFDDESLRRAVETSEMIARLAPEDPEYLGQLGAQSYPAVAQPWFDSTAELGPEARSEAAAEVTRLAERRGLSSSGYLPLRAGSEAVANSSGLFAYNRGTSTQFSTTVRTPDGTGSGWASVGHHDWSRVDAREAAERAVEKAERSRNPTPIEPGRWTVILEPAAASGLIGFLFNQLSARSADEGRSFFARSGGGTRIGEQILDERVTIYSDPADTSLYAASFDDEGLANRRMVWFENGRLQNLVYDRFWAQRQEREPTGFPAGYMMVGGDASMDDLIADTDRGLLVTRFWYMRVVDPRTILYTGLTRDGTFLIENGRITRPVQNLRWNESPLNILNNLEAMGRTERVATGEGGNLRGAVYAPPLKVRNFNFTSVSDAV